jgi:hypothetical protein
MKLYIYEWNKDFISLAKNLKNLKHLSISAREVKESLKRFKVFNNLEVFVLSFISLKDTDMKVIETLNLTKLEIFSCELKDESLKELTKMKRLAELRLTYGSMTDSGICELIENSSKLKTTEMNNNHIKETTIEAFIEKTLNNPKTNFKFNVEKLNRIRFTNKSIPKVPN